MKFNSQQYLAASKERITDLHHLRANERYSALVYTSGVAVECLLRAYQTGDRFSARHDLRSLMKQSSVLHFLASDEQRKFGAVLGEVWMRWKNNYRYASDDRLRSEYKQIKLTSRKKSDNLKVHAHAIADAATELVSMGARRWKSRQQ